MQDCIIAHAPIIDAGHIIVETKTETIIRDSGEQYEVRYPKPADSNEWTLPLDVLNQLTNLRATTLSPSMTLRECNSHSASRAPAQSRQHQTLD